MKVIFLDVDGVLNSGETLDLFDEFRVEFLKRIVDATGAKIVLSSSWKSGFIKDENGVSPCNGYSFLLFNLLMKYGLSLYDVTPNDKNRIRQNEIKQWLSEHEDVENFVIFDDETTILVDFWETNLIKTSILDYGVMVTCQDECTGICEEHIEPAINILNGNKLVKKRKK